uniref:Uncharacterized protein n=1 Tax=Noctiluca scintillans TaxID=2966 RepID=A0A7S1AEP9_NOCSC|mmetsp:Transcript_43432/g.114473  ORF Transcript_43432/g.114473 Transcript_43432/m.114473 type:complete len:351 (+) Transcript_43432:195-1247(+)
MAKLFSHHDTFHVHAVLGVVALLHILYRFLCMLACGKDTFAPSLTSVALLGVHFLLHASSFQFVLPRHRMRSKPMIWPEFRMHSACFAYRNLTGALLAIFFPLWWWRGPLTVSSMVVRLALALTTCSAADLVTSKVGSRDARTTNAMPYPPNTPPHIQDTVKKFYAKCQFAATSLALFACPVVSFGPVFAIEIAPLLMTLVRKGIVGARCYHVVYSLSLILMFPLMLASTLQPELAMGTFRAGVATTVAVRCRMKLRLSKATSWCAAVVGAFFLPDVLLKISCLYVWLLAGTVWSVIDSVAPSLSHVLTKRGLAASGDEIVGAAEREGVEEPRAESSSIRAGCDEKDVDE